MTLPNTLAYWARALEQHWGMTATLSQLDGEVDLNLLAEGEIPVVMKVMRPRCDLEFVDMQIAAIRHLNEHAPEVPVPDIVRGVDGAWIKTIDDEDGQPRLVWVMEKIDGASYASFRPKTTDLIRELGEGIGAMNAAWQDFSHPALARRFKWRLPDGGWIADQLVVIEDSKRQSLIETILGEFLAVQPALGQLPEVPIHNDVNDLNIIVRGSLASPPEIAGIIDFGDMCLSPRVCEVAIAGAYVVLDHPRPRDALAALVAGYHESHTLTAHEVDLIWPLLRMRLAVSIVISTLVARERPDDPYVTVSQQGAWDFLESELISAVEIGPYLRASCGLPVTDEAPAVQIWIDSHRGHFSPVLGRDLRGAPLLPLSVEASTIPSNPLAMTAQEAATLGSQGFSSEAIFLGAYGEPRLVYTSPSFRRSPWEGSDRRTVHLGVDVFAPAATRVHAPCGAVVVSVQSDPSFLDYGGVVVLRHRIEDTGAFFTLYGHLDPTSISNLSPGDKLNAGDAFARLGSCATNGGWRPHLHLQLAVALLGDGDNWPGAAYPDEWFFWSQIFPNPSALLNLDDSEVLQPPLEKESVLAARKRCFGSNLRLSYRDPVLLLRGWRHYLFDSWGQPYLDAYNNVPHVGHAHRRIRAVADDQLARMNANTRYLHPSQMEFAQALRAKLPPTLCVCYFVNSGTEANELALRLARAHTGGKDMITPDHGYHGNTTGAIDISAYKFNAPGGSGKPDWVHLIDVADEYRGRFRRDDPDRATRYAAQVDGALDAIGRRGGKLAGFIAETFPSVGGQIIPPQGYLAQVYRRIRAAGGVCIADEVQTGLGRLGHHYFGFEHQDVIPDIVVLGKPIGNGHPLGVVITTRAIADSFAAGPEFFSTFGGSNLSCRMGTEVLRIVDDEDLMQNARTVGDYLLAGLRELATRHDIVGDVRGMGLFVGVCMTADPTTRAPGTELAGYVVNRMREARILIGVEGPHDDVLKIRPPLTIETADVDVLIATLDEILGEARHLLRDTARSNRATRKEIEHAP